MEGEDYPKCPVCGSPVREIGEGPNFGIQGAATHFKVWACTNPACVLNTRIRDGDVGDREGRIIDQLKEACDRIGFLRIEEAYWILIPHDPSEEATCIEAVGDEDERLPGLRLPFQVTYNPKGSERDDLLAAMRRANWVLHVHNHPSTQSKIYISLCEPSRNDISFATHWKCVDPQLGNKMKFFVIQEETALEYALPSRLGERWLTEKWL